MNNSYSFTKSIKDKEQKILSYYKKINNVEQTKIFIVPKRKKGTKKNISRDSTRDKNELIKDEKDEKDEKDIKYDKDIKDEKKLTKKRVVDMGD